MKLLVNKTRIFMGTYYLESLDLLLVCKILHMFPGLNYPINQLCFVTYIHIILQFRTRLIILDHLKYNAIIAGYRGSLCNIFFLFAKIYSEDC